MSFAQQNVAILMSSMRAFEWNIANRIWKQMHIVTRTSPIQHISSNQVQRADWSGSFYFSQAMGIQIWWILLIDISKFFHELILETMCLYWKKKKRKKNMPWKILKYKLKDAHSKLLYNLSCLKLPVKYLIPA